MQKLIFASNNHGKLREIKSLLAGTQIEIIPQDELNIPAVEETGLTFVENAIIKARHACQQGKLPALAEDSGLEVDALQGAPGIYSARFAGEKASDEMNIKKLLAALLTVPEQQRTARYRSVIVLLRYEKDPSPLICQGTWEGSILMAPRGEQGFGYDPIFYVPSQQCSAAELSLQVKNQLSHRAQALQQLLHELKK